MSLEDFVAICLNKGMTLDEGHEMYKLYRYNQTGPPELPQDSFQKLLDKELYVDGRPCKALYTAFANAEQEFKDGSTYDETVKLQKRTLKLTSQVKRRETAVIPELDKIIDYMARTLFDFKHGKEEIKNYEEAVDYMNGDAELAKFYVTWYHLFPTQGGSAKNDGWEKLFHFKYTKNYRYRTGFPNHIVWFKSQARKYDMRMFLLGTFLCLKGGIDGTNCFFKNITTFKDEAEDWYNAAVDTIDELGMNVWSVFNPSHSKSFESVSSNVGGNLV